MSKKPRILIFIDWFLPGYKAGGPVQSCANLIAHLKEAFDFWVITRDTDYCENQPYTTVTPDTWNRLDDHLQIYYISATNLKYKPLLQTAREVNPDIVLINGIYSLYFSILPLFIARKLNCSKTIVSARGMLTPSAIQVKGYKKKAFLQAAKLMGHYRNVSFHATNNDEANYIKMLFGNRQEVKVAPNLSKKVIYDSPAVISKKHGELRLVSIARISPEKNLNYALEVLRNNTVKGKVTFDIYGPIYNEQYWDECQDLIAAINDRFKITYKGSIDSKQVHETLQQYHALFLPTQGENFGHIILESMAAGLPVIISDQTPWKNLQENRLGFDLSLSEPKTFADAIQHLLDLSQEEYSSYSRAAYLYAKEYMQNEDALTQNLNLFKLP